jgi:hypothetical protein
VAARVNLESLFKLQEGDVFVQVWPQPLLDSPNSAFRPSCRVHFYTLCRHLPVRLRVRLEDLLHRRPSYSLRTNRYLGFILQADLSMRTLTLISST